MIMSSSSCAALHQQSVADYNVKVYTCVENKIKAGATEENKNPIAIEKKVAIKQATYSL